MVMLPLLMRLPLIVTLSGGVALAMFLPAAHATILGHHHIAQSFFYSGTVVLVLMVMLGIALSNRKAPNAPRLQLAALVGIYLGLPLVMAIPLQQALPKTGFLNAWFEMVSCFTTTGATLFDDPKRLAPSLHLWRAMIGWFGGFFTLLTATALLAPMSLGGFELLSERSIGQLRGEGSSWGLRRPEPAERLWRFAKILAPFYGAITLILWLGLVISGEDNLVALVHAMGTISTSGVSMGGNLDILNSGLWGEALIAFFMIFAISRRFWPAMPSQPGMVARHKDPELILAAGLVLVTGIAVWARHFLAAVDMQTAQNWSLSLRALWGALFTALSFLTTTGYESSQWMEARGWSGLGNPGLVMLGLAMIGGGVATTAGGVKLMRLYALWRHGERELARMIHPSSVGGQGQYARRLREQGSYFAWLFFMLFALSFAVSTLVMTLNGQGFEQSLILTIAALCTTGSLASLAGPEPILYAHLAGDAKMILAVMMVVGRLETLAILALLAPSGWRN